MTQSQFQAAINAAWLEPALIAIDLLALTRTLLLDGEHAAHARWGRRLQRLEPDPSTAPYVRWMFAQRLAGCSIAGIARRL